MPPIVRHDLSELPEELREEIRQALGDEVGGTSVYVPSRDPREREPRYRNAYDVFSPETIRLLRGVLNEKRSFFLYCKSNYYERRNMKVRALYDMLRSDGADDGDVVRSVAESFNLHPKTVEGITKYSQSSPCQNVNHEG